MKEKNWKEIAKKLDTLCDEDFDSEMKNLATEMDEEEVGKFIEAVGELYPDRDEEDADDSVWEEYENLCYFIFLAFGDVHYAELDDEEYKEKIDALIRPLGFDLLADYGMENFLSRRHKATDINNCSFTYGGQKYSCHIEGEYLNDSVYDIMVNFRGGAEIYTKHRELDIGRDYIALLNDGGEVVRYLKNLRDGRFYDEDEGREWHEAQIIIWNRETEDVETEAVLGFISDADYLFPAKPINGQTS